MTKKIGFIGAGNMSEAMVGGIVTSKLIDPQNIMVSNPSSGKLEKLKNLYNVQISNNNNIDVAKFSDILILAVSPSIYPKVIDEIKSYVKKDVVILTIALGVSLSDVESLFGYNVPIVRTMPNTPTIVSEGMTAYCYNDHIKQDDLDSVIKILESFGKAEFIKEDLIHSVTGISGSAPAYVYMFMEAMADGAVALGMPRKQAYTFAGQTLLGSAKMLLETGLHPGELKDNVCSPGGATIKAVMELEECGMRNAVIKAVIAAGSK